MSVCSAIVPIYPPPHTLALCVCVCVCVHITVACSRGATGALLLLCCCWHVAHFRHVLLSILAAAAKAAKAQAAGAGTLSGSSSLPVTICRKCENNVTKLFRCNMRNRSSGSQSSSGRSRSCSSSSGGSNGSYQYQCEMAVPQKPHPRTLFFAVTLLVFWLLFLLDSWVWVPIPMPHCPMSQPLAPLLGTLSLFLFYLVSVFRHPRTRTVFAWKLFCTIYSGTTTCCFVYVLHLCLGHGCGCLFTYTLAHATL